MTRFIFRQAVAKDDVGLRHLMASEILPGRIAISFRREPNFFSASHLQGCMTQVMCCVDSSNQNIVGVASRSIDWAHINGQQQLLGYLGDLRIAQSVRRQFILARGFQFLYCWHYHAPVPFYTTVIYEGNDLAKKILTSGRAVLPLYHSLGKIHTPAISLSRQRKPPPRLGLSIETGDVIGLEAICNFLNDTLATKQLTPVYSSISFAQGRFKSIKPENFCVATNGEEIIGVMALWDQHNFRQTYVEAYTGYLKYLRPTYNLFADLFSWNRLPNPGHMLRHVYFSCIAIKNNDPAVFDYLFWHAYNRAQKAGYHYAMIGLHERDPLLVVPFGYHHIPACGKLYLVDFEHTLQIETITNDHIPYIEIACL
jgi:hypothetical protein